MIKEAKDLKIKNKYIVIQCGYSDDKFTNDEQQTLSDLHYKKIEISDAIYVINVNTSLKQNT